jgi:hypothetical protein
MEKLELIFASNGPAKLASKVRAVKAIIANAWTGKGTTPKGLLVAELVGVIALLSRIEYDEFDEIKNSANNPDYNETDDTLLMSQNKTLQVPGAAGADGDQLQAGPSGDNNIVEQDDDDDNSEEEEEDQRESKQEASRMQINLERGQV